MEVTFVDQGYTGEQLDTTAAEHGIRLEVVKLPEVKRSSVLLPRRQLVDRSFGWTTRYRCFMRDYERLSETLVSLEPTTYHLRLAAALAPSGIAYRLVNPLSIRRYREGDQLARTKHDRAHHPHAGDGRLQHHLAAGPRAPRA